MSPSCNSLSRQYWENLIAEIVGNRMPLESQREKAEEDMSFQHSESNNVRERKKENG